MTTASESGHRLRRGPSSVPGPAGGAGRDLCRPPVPVTCSCSMPVRSATSKGGAFWSKSVQIEDAPRLRGGSSAATSCGRYANGWTAARCAKGGNRRPHPAHRYRVPTRLRAQAPGAQRRADAVLRWKTSVEPLRSERPIKHTPLPGPGTVVVASGFDDVWPDIEVNEQAERLYQRYQTVFRFAGNRRGWHVLYSLRRAFCTLTSTSPSSPWETTPSAPPVAPQDFTSKITILTNGRPPRPSGRRDLANRAGAGYRDCRDPKSRHTSASAPTCSDFGLPTVPSVYFDGFPGGRGADPQHAVSRWLGTCRPTRRGLLIVNDDRQVLTSAGEPVPGLFAAGGHCVG